MEISAMNDAVAEQDGQRLVFCDLETTGLEPSEGFVLEVGFMITDLNLRTIDEFHSLIWDSPGYDKYITEANLDPSVWKMHTESHLLDECKDLGDTIFEANAKLTHWLDGHGIAKDEPLVGSSVQFDRGWLEMHFPEVIEKFSYRNIDISTVKELCRRYNPELYERLDEETEPAKTHRVMSDLLDTINELEFYVKNFMFDAVSNLHG